MKYFIDVTRISYGIRTIEVEANSQQEAEGIAMDTCGNFFFDEKAADYELSNGPTPASDVTPQ